MSDRSQLLPLSVPALPQDDTGWRAKLSKWQVALLIGMPLAAAAAIAGLVFLLSRRRRTEPASPPPPVPSQSPTPVTSPAAKKPEEGDSKKSPLQQARDLKTQGNEFYRQEKFEEAAKCYEEAIRLSQGAGEKESVMAIYHQNLGAVYDAMARKETDQDTKTSQRRLAVQCCDRAIALNPRYVKALLRRYQMHYALGNKEEAILDVTRVLLLDESQAQTVSKTVTRLLKDISLSMAAENFPQLGPLAPTKHLVKTYSESFLWQDDLSEERLKALWLSSQPDRPDQSESREQSHDPQDQQAPTQQSQQNGETEEESPRPQEGKEQQVAEKEEAASAAALDSAEAKGSEEERMAGFAEEPFVVAAAQLGRCDLGNILELLGEAIGKGNPVFKPHAMLMRGGLHSLWRMEKEALKDLQDVINMEGLPKEMYVNALIKKAVIFAGGMEMDKCKACFEKALAIDPGSGDVFVHRARVGLETEDPSQLTTVVQDLEKAVAQAPDFPYAQFTLASAYHRMAGVQQSMQLVETARVKFNDAVKRFPTFADGLVLYALFLQDVSDFQSAEDVLKKAVQMEPENPLGHFSLGLLQLVVRSDIEQTIVYMQKALAVDSSCVQAYDTMASIEMQRGNTARGAELYDKAIQFSRNQLEMSQAYVAKKIFTVQEQVCKEYGVPVNQVPSAPFPGPGGP